MKTIHRFGSGVLGVTATLLLLAGPAAAQDDEGPDIAQISRGGKAWSQQCARCHNLRDPKELEDFEWEVSVTHMRIRANLPGEMARDIAAFLKANN